MKKVSRQVIAHVGINKNNVLFDADCLKDCVKNIKSEHIPLTDEFNRKFPIGFMTNFEYKEAKIYADIYMENSLDIDKVIRCSYEVLKKLNINPIKIKKCKLIDGAIIDKIFDLEGDL